MSLETILFHLSKDIVTIIDKQLSEICPICLCSVYETFQYALECAMCGNYYHPKCHTKSIYGGVCNSCTCKTKRCFLCQDLFSGRDAKYGGKTCCYCKKSAHHFCRIKYQTFCHHNRSRKKKKCCHNIYWKHCLYCSIKR